MTERTFTASIVGMKYHPVDFDVNQMALIEEIELCPEPENPHDENAVAVYILSQHIGYIDKKSAKWVSRLIQEGDDYFVEAIESDDSSTIKIKITMNFDAVKAPKPVEGSLGGLYRITICSLQQVYVGQSNDINRRIASHWLDLQMGRHANSELQKAWSFGGFADLKVDVIEQAPPNQSELERQRWLGSREKHWISHYRNLGKSINILEGEVVATKAARVQFEAEVAAKNRDHDTYVKNRKNVIAAEMQVLNTRVSPTTEQICALYQKLNAAEARIKESGGLFARFSSSKQLLVEQAKGEVRILNGRIEQLEKSIQADKARIAALGLELKGLKTTKEIDAANKRISEKTGHMLWKAGIDRSFSERKKSIT